MIPFLFNRKKGEAVIDSEAKQKTHSFFACLMGCITRLWKEAIQKGHDVQLLLNTPFTNLSLKKSKEHLESILKAIHSEYQLIAFRLNGIGPKKEYYELLISNGLCCDTSVHAGGKSFPFAYSNHQPYFANLYAPQLKAPPSEKSLIEIPIFTPSPPKTWSVDESFTKKFKHFLIQKNKLKKLKKSIPFLQKFFHLSVSAYAKFYWPRFLFNKIVPAKLIYFICDHKPENLVKNNYFVSDGKIVNSRNILSIKPLATFITLSEMAQIAQKELLNSVRKNSSEEAEFQVLENYTAIMGEERNAAQSYYLQDLIPWDRSTLLDFGCGTGYWTKRIVQIYPWIKKAVGIDYGDDFIQKANQLYKNEQISFANENFESMSFQNDSFDCVYADATLEHAFDVNRALQEIYRVLTDGGVLIALIPSDARNPDYVNPGHTWKTFPEETRLRLQETGFVNIEIQEIDIYKTFAMVPYPPANNQMMFIRAWKLPPSSPKLTRVHYALRWLHNIELAKLSKIDPTLNHCLILKKLLEKEGYAPFLDKKLLHLIIDGKQFTFEPSNYTLIG